MLKSNSCVFNGLIYRSLQLTDPKTANRSNGYTKQDNQKKIYQQLQQHQQENHENYVTSEKLQAKLVEFYENIR